MVAILLGLVGVLSAQAAPAHAWPGFEHHDAWPSGFAMGDRSTKLRSEGPAKFDGERLAHLDLTIPEGVALLGRVNAPVSLVVDDTVMANADVREKVAGLGFPVGLQGRLSDASVAHLRDWTHLRSLDLEYSAELTGAGMESLRGLPKLVYLNVSQTSIGERGFRVLATLPRLQYLNATGTKGAGKPGAFLAPLVGLEVARLGRTGTNDDVVAQLCQLPKLERINLDDGDITDQGANCLTGLKHLRQLHLRGTKVSDLSLPSLAGLPSLESLNLERTAITDDGLRHLASCEPLEELGLSRNDLTVAGLAHLADAPSLKKVVAYGTQVTPADLPTLPASFRAKVHLELW
jgi:hypothetical protein